MKSEPCRKRSIHFCWCVSEDVPPEWDLDVDNPDVHHYLVWYHHYGTPWGWHWAEGDGWGGWKEWILLDPFGWRYGWIFMLVQERRNSSASAMELRLSCTNPLIWYVIYTTGNLTFYHNYWEFMMKFLDIYIASPFKLNIKEIPKFLEIGIVGIIIFVSLKRHNERLNLIMEIYVMTDQYLLNGVIPLARRFSWWGSYYFSNKGHTIVKIGKVK